MASILNTGISALAAFQQHLTTTGHNIANVNTDGYSRQSVDFATRNPERSSAGFMGTGVSVNAISRSYDSFLADRVRTFTASDAEYSVYYDRASQVDDVLGNEAAGLDSALQEFYAAMHDVANDPTSIPARSVLLSRGDMLADRFQSLDSFLGDMRSLAQRDMANHVTMINSISSSIVDVNARIQEASFDPINPPNDLLDERDRLVDELSRYVRVSTLEQEDGAMNVFIGNGQPLVVGTKASTLELVNNPAALDQKEIQLNVVGGSSLTVTDQLSGGMLGGLLRFREEVLDPAQNELGLVALGLADSVNTQHALGYDLDGNAGGTFFNVASPQVLADSTNAGAATVSVAFSDVNDLTGDEYNLSFDGSNWSITNQTTGAQTVLGAGGATYTHEGVAYTIGAGAVNGDSFTSRPSRLGAYQLSMALTDPRGVAAAQAATGVGDNRNALALANLQGSAVLLGSSASVSEAYGLLIAGVGTQTQQARDNAAVQEQLKLQAEGAKDRVSGVNLDEEAADLVRYQQAYSAAAQVINVANTLFDTLLGAVRR